MSEEASENESPEVISSGAPAGIFEQAASVKNLPERTTPQEINIAHLSDEELMSAVDAPLTGEEVALKIDSLNKAGVRIDENSISEQEFKSYNDWHKQQHVNFWGAVGEGMLQTGKDLGKGVFSAATDWKKLALGTGLSFVATPAVGFGVAFGSSLAEGFARGTRDLGGLFVMAANHPDSPIYRMFVNPSDDPKQSYQDFLTLSRWNAQSEDIISGKSNVLMPERKTYEALFGKQFGDQIDDFVGVNKELATASSYLLDPTVFMTFGAGKVATTAIKAATVDVAVKAIKAGLGGESAIGRAVANASRNAMKATIMERMARGMGTAADMAVKPIEGTFKLIKDTTEKALGTTVSQTANGTQRVTRAKVGVNPQSLLHAGMGAAGVYSLFTIPYAMPVTAFYSLAKGASMLGHGLADIAKGTETAATKALTHNVVADAIKGSAPMLGYLNDMSKNMAHGAFYGGLIGYAASGEEGAAGGIGVGSSLGAVGHGVGMLHGTISGNFAREQVRSEFNSRVQEIMHTDGDILKATRMKEFVDNVRQAHGEDAADRLQTHIMDLEKGKNVNVAYMTPEDMYNALRSDPKYYTDEKQADGSTKRVYNQLGQALLANVQKGGKAWNGMFVEIDHKTGKTVESPILTYKDHEQGTYHVIVNTEAMLRARDAEGNLRTVSREGARPMVETQHTATEYTTEQVEGPRTGMTVLEEGERSNVTIPAKLGDKQSVAGPTPAAKPEPVKPEQTQTQKPKGFTPPEPVKRPRFTTPTGHEGIALSFETRTKNIAKYLFSEFGSAIETAGGIEALRKNEKTKSRMAAFERLSPEEQSRVKELVDSHLSDLKKEQQNVRNRNIESSKKSQEASTRQSNFYEQKLKEGMSHEEIAKLPEYQKLVEETKSAIEKSNKGGGNAEKTVNRKIEMDLNSGEDVKEILEATPEDREKLFKELVERDFEPEKYKEILEKKLKESGVMSESGSFTGDTKPSTPTDKGDTYGIPLKGRLSRPVVEPKKVFPLTGPVVPVEKELHGPMPPVYRTTSKEVTRTGQAPLHGPVPSVERPVYDRYATGSTLSELWHVMNRVRRRVGIGTETTSVIHQWLIGDENNAGKAFTDREATVKFLNALYDKNAGPRSLEERVTWKTAINDFEKTGKMTPESQVAFSHMIEELGESMFLGWESGKPFDYIYRGGDLGFARNLVESLKDAFVNMTERNAVNLGADINTKQAFADWFKKTKEGKRFKLDPAIEATFNDLIRIYNDKGMRNNGRSYDNLYKISSKTLKQQAETYGFTDMIKEDSKTGEVVMKSPEEIHAERHQKGMQCIRELLASAKNDPSVLNGLDFYVTERDPRSANVGGAFERLDKESRAAFDPNTLQTLDTTGMRGEGFVFSSGDDFSDVGVSLDDIHKAQLEDTRSRGIYKDRGLNAFGARGRPRTSPSGKMLASMEQAMAMGHTVIFRGIPSEAAFSIIEKHVPKNVSKNIRMIAPIIADGGHSKSNIIRGTYHGFEQAQEDGTILYRERGHNFNAREMNFVPYGMEFHLTLKNPKNPIQQYDRPHFSFKINAFDTDALNRRVHSIWRESPELSKMYNNVNDYIADVHKTIDEYSTSSQIPAVKFFGSDEYSRDKRKYVMAAIGAAPSKDVKGQYSIVEADWHYFQHKNMLGHINHPWMSLRMDCLTKPSAIEGEKTQMRISEKQYRRSQIPTPHDNQGRMYQGSYSAGDASGPIDIISENPKDFNENIGGGKFSMSSMVKRLNDTGRLLSELSKKEEFKPQPKPLFSSADDFLSGSAEESNFLKSNYKWADEKGDIFKSESMQRYQRQFGNDVNLVRHTLEEHLAGQGTVDSYNSDLGTGVPVVLPAFHGGDFSNAGVKNASMFTGNKDGETSQSRNMVGFKNPLVINYEGLTRDAKEVQDYVNSARRKGHDGLILLGAKDENGIPSNIYALLKGNEKNSVIVDSTLNETAHRASGYTEGARFYSSADEDRLPIGAFSANNPETVHMAREFKAGKSYGTGDGKFVIKLNPDKSFKVGMEYERMKHDPFNPKVRAAFEAFAKETLEQMQLITDRGYKPEMHFETEEPYPDSKSAIRDIRENKRLKVLSTELNFGDRQVTQKDISENPLLRMSQYKDANGNQMRINDVFRFVHDFFGHSERGNSFGPLGEENAWDVHARMYSPLARRAMTSGTRGQNSWVNFVHEPNKEINRKRDMARKLEREGRYAEAIELRKTIGQTRFADQKIGLMPEWTSRLDEELTPIERQMYGTHTVSEGTHGLYSAGDETHNIHEPDAEEFVRIGKEAKSLHKYGTSVYIKTPEEYKGHTLLMAGDGRAIAAITPDGELGSVVRGKTGTADDVHAVVTHALASGKVKWLNAFDTVLPSMYHKFGFEAMARISFVDEYRPEGWDYEAYSKFNGGRPDVVFMGYVGDGAKPYELKKGILVKDYDDAVELTKKRVEESKTGRPMFSAPDPYEFDKVTDVTKRELEFKDLILEGADMQRSLNQRMDAGEITKLMVNQAMNTWHKKRNTGQTVMSWGSGFMVNGEKVPLEKITPDHIRDMKAEVVMRDKNFKAETSKYLDIERREAKARAQAEKESLQEEVSKVPEQETAKQRAKRLLENKFNQKAIDYLNSLDREERRKTLRRLDRKADEREAQLAEERKLGETKAKIIERLANKKYLEFLKENETAETEGNPPPHTGDLEELAKVAAQEDARVEEFLGKVEEDPQAVLAFIDENKLSHEDAKAIAEAKLHENWEETGGITEEGTEHITDLQPLTHEEALAEIKAENKDYNEENGEHLWSQDEMEKAASDRVALRNRLIHLGDSVKEETSRYNEKSLTYMAREEFAGTEWFNENGDSIKWTNKDGDVLQGTKEELEAKYGEAKTKDLIPVYPEKMEKAVKDLQDKLDAFIKGQGTTDRERLLMLFDLMRLWGFELNKNLLDNTFTPRKGLILTEKDLATKEGLKEVLGARGDLFVNLDASAVWSERLDAMPDLFNLTRDLISDVRGGAEFTHGDKESIINLKQPKVGEHPLINEWAMEFAREYPDQAKYLFAQNEGELISQKARDRYKNWRKDYKKKNQGREPTETEISAKKSEIEAKLKIEFGAGLSIVPEFLGVENSVESKIFKERWAENQEIIKANKELPTRAGRRPFHSNEGLRAEAVSKAKAIRVNFIQWMFEKSNEMIRAEAEAFETSLKSKEMTGAEIEARRREGYKKQLELAENNEADTPVEQKPKPKLIVQQPTVTPIEQKSKPVFTEKQRQAASLAEAVKRAEAQGNVKKVTTLDDKVKAALAAEEAKKKTSAVVTPKVETPKEVKTEIAKDKEVKVEKRTIASPEDTGRSHAVVLEKGIAATAPENSKDVARVMDIKDGLTLGKSTNLDKGLLTSANGRFTVFKAKGGLEVVMNAHVSPYNNQKVNKRIVAFVPSPEHAQLAIREYDHYQRRMAEQSGVPVAQVLQQQAPVMPVQKIEQVAQQVAQQIQQNGPVPPVKNPAVKAETHPEFNAVIAGLKNMGMSVSDAKERVTKAINELGLQATAQDLLRKCFQYGNQKAKEVAVANQTHAATVNANPAPVSPTKASQVTILPSPAAVQASLGASYPTIATNGIPKPESKFPTLTIHQLELVGALSKFSEFPCDIQLPNGTKGQGSMYKNDLGYMIIQNGLNTWRVYNPSAGLIAIAANQQEGMDKIIEAEYKAQHRFDVGKPPASRPTPSVNTPMTNNVNGVTSQPQQPIAGLANFSSPPIKKTDANKPIVKLPEGLMKFKNYKNK